MSKVRIELNYANVGKLLKSQELADFLKKEADSRASALGSGYEADIYVAGTRVVSSIYTATPEAVRDNLQHNTLLKAVSK